MSRQYVAFCTFDVERLLVATRGAADTGPRYGSKCHNAEAMRREYAKCAADSSASFLSSMNLPFTF